MKKLLFPVVVLLAVISVLAGCGKAKPDFFVLAENANGVATQSKVMWRGVEVGKVTAVSPDAGKIRLDAVLLKEYRGQLRTGIKAKPMKNLTGQGVPVLNLFGGSDPAAPVLPKGSQIPEATFFETLQYTNFWDWFSAAGGGKWSVIIILVVVVLAGIAWKVLKGLSRLIILVAAIALVAGSGWVIRQQWDKYKSSMVSPDIQKQVDDLLNFPTRSTEIKEIRDSIKNDVKALLIEARQQGTAGVESAKEKINVEILQKIEELKTQGKQDAVKELEQIKDAISVF